MRQWDKRGGNREKGMWESEEKTAFRRRQEAERQKRKTMFAVTILMSTTLEMFSLLREYSVKHVPVRSLLQLKSIFTSSCSCLA